MTNTSVEPTISAIEAMIAEEGVDFTSVGLTAGLRDALLGLIDKNRDELQVYLDELSQWSRAADAESMVEWLENGGWQVVVEATVESAMLAASRAEYGRSMSSLAENVRPANVEEIANRGELSLLFGRQSGSAVCVFHVSRSDRSSCQVDDWKDAALEWMPDGSKRSDIEVFTGLDALKLVLRERIWSHIPSFTSVAVASSDWLRLLALSWLAERAKLEVERTARKADASDLAASSRAKIGGRDYQRLPKVTAGFSWALGGPGIEMTRVEADSRIFVPAPDIAVNARLAGGVQGEESMAIVPAGYAVLPPECARNPHQTILPIDLEGGEDSPPLAVAVAAASKYVISAPAGKLGIRILAAAHVSRNGLHKTSLRELAREINPGARLVNTHFENVARGLIQLDGLRLLLPNGWAYRVFDCALPPWRVLTPADYDTEIYVGTSRTFERNLTELHRRLGGKYRGEFLFDLNGTMALPTNRPGTLRQYIRAAALWNAYWMFGTRGMPDVRNIPQVDTVQWAAMTNYLPPAAVEHMRGRNDGGARSSYSRAITATLEDLEFLASKEGGCLVKLDKANRKVVRLLPPEEYLEAKAKCRSDGAPTAKGKALRKKRQSTTQEKAKR